jgi:transcriptional regulator with XRE-family HTH domain
MTLGDFLRRKREDKGWTQPEAAARAGIEQSYLSKLETGRSTPSDEVFEKLRATYSIAPDELAEAMSAEEIERLREIRAIRGAAASAQKQRLAVMRGWLLAGLALLMAGGGMLGLTLTAEDEERWEYRYRSMGLLGPEENIDAYRWVNVWPQGESDAARIEAELNRTMTARLDPHDMIVDEDRGGGFIVNLDDGRRYYDQVNSELITTPTPLRWLFGPALMLLFGAFGCFFISFRWKPAGS